MFKVAFMSMVHPETNVQFFPTQVSGEFHHNLLADCDIKCKVYIKALYQKL